MARGTGIVDGQEALMNAARGIVETTLARIAHNAEKPRELALGTGDGRYHLENEEDRQYIADSIVRNLFGAGA